MDPAFKRNLGADRRAEQIAKATEEQNRLLLEDECYAKKFVARRDATLLSLATVYADKFDRNQIREMADTVCRTAFVRRWRTETGNWEDFVCFEGQEHADRTLRSDAGVVITPMHFGNYRLLGFWLVARGHAVHWLSDQENSNYTRSLMTDGPITRYLPLSGGQSAQFRVSDLRARFHNIDSTSPAAAWDMFRALRRGATVAIFPDGNSGIENRGTTRHCPQIPFLGQVISVHTGAAGIAAAAGKSVLPIIPFDLDGTPGLRFEAPIVAGVNESKEKFRFRATRELFRILEREIIARPLEWEEWHVLFRWMNREPKSLGPPAPERIARSLARPLEGSTLHLAIPTLWCLNINSECHAIDVNTWNSLGTSPELTGLIDAAEAGMATIKALTQFENAAAALAALELLIGVGFVEIKHISKNGG